jgi:folate-binding protein YgfZ
MIHGVDKYLQVIKISGADAEFFLQGQTCNDVLSLIDGSYQLSANLNNKGRVFANFWLYRKKYDEFYMIIAKNMAELIIKKLKIYVLRSKVMFEHVNTNIILTLQNDQKFAYDFILNFNNSNIMINFEINDQIKQLNDDNIWSKFLIDNQIPLIEISLSEKLLIQNINFDAKFLNGVSYTKGCYIGQEIVARMHYLGKNKQKMYKFYSNQKLEKSNAVYTSKLINQEIGVVIDVSFDNNLYFGLVSLQNNYIDDIYSDKEFLNKLIIKEI